MIRLRKIEPSDLPYLYQWENDADAWADGANHNPLSQQDLRSYIANTTGDIYRDGQLRLIVEEVADSGLLHAHRTDAVPLTIGVADLFDLDIRNRRAAIGLYIAPHDRGRGLAKEVLRQLEDYAFVHLNLRVIYAIIAERNIPCNALFEHSHYIHSGFLTDWTLEGRAVLWLKTCDKGGKKR